jgi:hypothetical protein
MTLQFFQACREAFSNRVNSCSGPLNAGLTLEPRYIFHMIWFESESVRQSRAPLG